MTRDVMYTVKEVADYLGVSASSVYRYINEGYLVARKNPGEKGSYSITKVDLQRFVSSCICGGEHASQK